MARSTALRTREIRPIKAALFMLAACGCFSFNSIFVRFAAEDVHPFEIAFFRNLFAIVFILLLVLPVDGMRVFRCQRPGLLMLRGFVNAASMLAWFYAVPLMPLADLTALGFTAPLWATLLAALFLGERIRIRRWSATLIGFAGTLIIIQPGFKDFHWATWLVLFSSASWGATVIVVRHLTAYERPNTILFYQAVMMALCALVPSLFFWQWPPLPAFVWLLALGALAAGAHWFHVRAYAMQEVAALQPLDFSRLPIVAAAAWLLFGEIAGLEVWLGAAVVFGAGLYISYREAQLKRQRLR
ncbi:MAG: DMT family transporter [Gammaproteobacteria bacterium]|nr:DMT family transporter [Gammaproteobacteria bacterium]